MATETKKAITNYEYLRVYLNNLLDANVTYIESEEIEDNVKNNIKVIHFLSEKHGIENKGIITFEKVESNGDITFHGADVYATMFGGYSNSDIIARKFIEGKVYDAIKPYDMSDINRELKVFAVIKKEYDLLVKSGKTFGEYFLAIRACYEMASSNMLINSSTNTYYSSKINRTVGLAISDKFNIEGKEVKSPQLVVFYKAIDCTLAFNSFLN